MDTTPADPLIVAISSRALFDLETSHALFEREGLDAHAAFQREHEDEPEPDPRPALLAMPFRPCGSPRRQD